MNNGSMHYGVLGMKWGVRKSRAQLAGATNRKELRKKYKDAKREDYLNYGKEIGRYLGSSDKKAADRYNAATTDYQTKQKALQSEYKAKLSSLKNKGSSVVSKNANKPVSKPSSSTVNSGKSAYKEMAQNGYFGLIGKAISNR